MQIKESTFNADIQRHVAQPNNKTLTSAWPIDKIKYRKTNR